MIKEKETSFFWLFVLLCASLVWSGGYYEYSSVIIGVCIAVFLIVFRRKRLEKTAFENYMVFSAIIAFMYWISSIYAVDCGMAMTGAAKKSVIFLFALALAVTEQEQRKRILYKLPEIAVVLTAVPAIASLAEPVRKFVFSAGRFCGTFGYANTYALFALLALLVLLETWKQRAVWKDVAMLLGFLAGLWFSGSRYTWVLAFVALIAFALAQKGIRKYVCAVLGILLALTVCAGTVFRQTEAMGRLFTTNFSTLYGRLLYWQDGLSLAIKHPFGMGYLGYYYKQNEIQTGVYTVRYVHNDLLQWVLDIGWIPAIVLLLIIILAICNKKRPFLEKLLLSVILLHSMMEFDLEHTGMAFLLVLVLSCSKEAVFRKNCVFGKTDSSEKPGGLQKAGISGKICMALSVLIGCVCLYFAVPLSLYAAEKTKTAVQWYPVYTDAQLANLSLEKDNDKADRLADKILGQNDTAFLAYDAKAQVAFNQNRFSDMVRYKKKAIARNKFDAAEYNDYLVMLNEILSYAIENGDEELAMEMAGDMQELLTIIEDNKKTVSPLGKKIDDKVEIDFPKDITEEIRNLGG
ncbi:MAG: O-antigen ligase family protein [Butyribacter sp.]|nr:O-antigen ligase family protein [bacterium]MDY3854395.1 O-antigen ligase family protein [Butyribacter sp.]